MKYITAESVCAGHPDKLCDLIADSILDEALSKDENSRVACEVMATGKRIIIAGEITCSKKLAIRKVVRNVLQSVGYDPYRFLIYVFINKQSQDISDGVTESIEKRHGVDNDLSALDAGDQGTVYGYATDETYEALPLPLVLAQGICKRVDEVRKSGVVQNLLPDGKAQVTVEYDGGQAKRVKTIVVSVQHTEEVSEEELRNEIIKNVLLAVFSYFEFDDETEILINPSGRFVIGATDGDTGLTGRKLMVDTYGGLAAHGGGAFSGKDATKVDRSGAYFARYIAKHVVKSGFAKKCEVAISYAIGKAEPVALQLDTFGTDQIDEDLLASVIQVTFDLRPAAIINELSLREPNFSKTSAYGHFGSLEFPWEVLTRREDLYDNFEKVRGAYANSK